MNNNRILPEFESVEEVSKKGQTRAWHPIGNSPNMFHKNAFFYLKVTRKKKKGHSNTCNEHEMAVNLS